MATRRFSHLDDFVLKDGKIGIGTVDPSASLEVVGTLKAANIKATDSGITTSISLEGVLHQNMQYPDSVSINSGDSGTLSGEVVIGTGTTLSVGTGATTGQGIIESFKVSNTFTPPIGGTVDRPTAPQPGALFYNKDFKTIEYWDGNFWRQVDYTTRSGRGVFAGRSSPTVQKLIDYIQISTIGNAVSFGDLINAAQARAGGYSDGIRGIFCGGFWPAKLSECEYITIASQGNGLDFKDLSGDRDFVASCSSSTRGLTAGGREPAAVNTIEYVQIQTLGDHKDFGDLFKGVQCAAAASSPTRGVWAGGIDSPSDAVQSLIQTINFTAKGIAVNFGDLTKANGLSSGGCSNSVRALFAGGHSPGLRFDNIDVLNIVSGGNAIHCGNLDQGLYASMGVASQTRAVFGGGQDASSPSNLKVNSIQYVNISTLGNAVDFGELTEIGRSGGSVSDSHGGLGGF